MPTNTNTQVETYASQPQLKSESPAQYQARQAAAHRLHIADVAGNTSSQRLAAVEATQITNAAVRAEAERNAKAEADSKLQNSGVEAIKSAGNAISAAVVAIAAAIPDYLRAYQAPSASLLRGLRGRTGTQYGYDSPTSKAGGPDGAQRSQDPPTFVEVMRLPTDINADVTASTATSLLKYNDFFITNTQEVDAEKAEVSETFGAPHVFATGRYMRKVMISGVCRTGPINAGALDLDPITNLPLYPNISGAPDDVKARLIVPQTLGLRVLYDRALRASEQISRGLFTRLHVDGEVYSGWFTTLNLMRDSDHESFASFTMSMLVFERYHKDENRAQLLVSSVTAVAKNAFDDTAAIATLASFAGIMKLTINSKVGEVPKEINETLAEQLRFSSPIEITVDGVSQPILVDLRYNNTRVRGFMLKFGNSESELLQLEGAAPGRGTYGLYPVITSFDELLKTITDAGGTLTGAAGAPQKMDIEVQMTPRTGGDIITLQVKLNLNTKRTPKISGLVAKITNWPTSPEFGNTVNAAAKDIFTGGGLTFGLSMLFYLQSAGGTALGLTTSQVAGIKLVLMDPEKDDVTRVTEGPSVAARTGTIGTVVKAESDAASASGAAKLAAVPTVTLVEVDATRVRINATISFSQLAAALGNVANLATTNPFASAKNLVTSLRFKLTGLPGFNDVMTPAVVVDAAYETSWMSNMLSNMISASTSEIFIDSGTEGGAFPSTVLSEITFAFSLGVDKNNQTMAQRVAAEPEVVRQAVAAIVQKSTFKSSTGQSPDFSKAVVAILTPTTVTVWSVPSGPGTSSRPFVGTLTPMLPEGITIMPYLVSGN